MTPGSNLLALALRAIKPQAVEWRRWLSSTTDASGLTSETYADPVTLYGSFQSVPAARLVLLGLEMNKTYRVFYASVRFQDPGRDNCAGDLLEYDGRRWQALDIPSGWFAMDGWDALLVVDVGPPE